MKINKIAMRNFKGQNTEQVLTGKDIFIGKNGVGKSSRLEALNLAMLGYIPNINKKAEDIFKLATDDSMEVKLSADEISFSRSFSKKTSNKKDGTQSISIKQDLNMNPVCGERTFKKKQEKLQELIGNFPVMLDFTEFLNLSDTKQKEFIYNMSGISSISWDKERVSNTLKRSLLTADLKNNNTEHFKSANLCIDETLKQYLDKFTIEQGNKTA